MPTDTLTSFESTLKADYDKAWKEYYKAVENLIEVLKVQMAYIKIINDKPYYSRFSSPV